MGEKTITTVTREPTSKEKYQCWISVIIPAYNSEVSLPRCLNSLFKQKFKKFEIIVVDDGSHDNTSMVAETLLKNSGLKFKIIKQENSGEGSARNCGIRNARGHFIYFIDSDDYIEPSCLEKLIESIKDCDFSFCGFHKVEEGGKFLVAYEQNYQYLSACSYGLDVIVAFLRKQIWISIGCGLYKREIVEKEKIYFREECRHGADQDFILRYLNHCKKVNCVPENLLFYVQHKKSISKTVEWEIFDGSEMWKDLVMYFRREGLTESIILLIQNYRLPMSILLGSISLAKGRSDTDKLVEFLKRSDVRSSLQSLRILSKRTKEYRYLLLSFGFRNLPRTTIFLLNALSTL